jgi:guanine deaminase
MSEAEFVCCHATGSAISHCPTSNLFLGSGLFRVFDAKRKDRPVRTGIGTDVGGGTSLSQLRSLGAAYMVGAMNGTRLTASQAFFLATRGGAESLYLDDRIGSIEEGHEADLVVLDLEATELIRFRLAAAGTVEEQLFAMMTLADPRLVRATFVAGEKVYDRDRAEPFLYPG